MKKKWLIAGCVAAAIILVVGVGTMLNKKSTIEEEQNTASVETIEDSSAISSSSADSEEEKETKKSKEKKEDADEDEEASEEAVEGGGYSGGGSGSSVKPAKKEENVKPREVISLPYTCPGTNLVLENLSSYDGEYIEDGSDKQVSNVAIAVFRNTGSNSLEFGTVKIEQGNRVLEFEFSGIGAGDQVAVLEKNAQSFSADPLYSADAVLAEVSELEMSSSLVTVEELEGGDLKLTNISGADIPCVRIFYKFFMKDQNAFVGGITYNSKVTDVKAGSSVVVCASHYKDGSSKVVMVKTYDTAD